MKFCLDFFFHVITSFAFWQRKVSYLKGFSDVLSHIGIKIHDVLEVIK
jgi:hypothetical protein